MAKLELRSATKVFPGRGQTRGEVVALQDITVSFESNQFSSVVGSSGSGKSTLLFLLAGLERPTEGGVLLDGAPVLGPGADRGVLFQEYALFPWLTVRGNIGFPLQYGPARKLVSKHERAERIRHYAELVGLRGAEDRYPHELSGGMKQRCALGRLLAADPAVLLMDEPLAAVDAQTRLVLQEEIADIWGQRREAESRKTVVYVTHALDEAVFLSDVVVVLSAHPGRVKEIIEIDLPRPRTHDTRLQARFTELTEAIWRLVESDVRTAAAVPAESMADGGE
ncbi:MAG: ABC transporter ATP-binding protein [Candidatus Dormibacteria bacterium]